MKKPISFPRLFLHLTVGTVLSILVFFSLSFLTFLWDQPTFNPSVAQDYWIYQSDIGFPFTYFEQIFTGADAYPFTRAQPVNFLLDCILTWVCVALPYFLIKFKQEKKKVLEIGSDVLDTK